MVEALGRVLNRRRRVLVIATARPTDPAIADRRGGCRSSLGPRAALYEEGSGPGTRRLPLSARLRAELVLERTATSRTT